MAKQGKKKTTAKRSGKQQTGAANTMWGGRFASAPAEIMSRINASIDVDIRLFAQDIAGSRAHCDMLAATGIISRKDAAAIRKGLDQIEKEIAAGQMALNPALEDIHMHVESRLAELIGDAAGRLHTARSRNDQVATDFRLWVRQAMDQMQDELASLQQALLARAEEHADTVMPGFTHLQTAQPVTFGHHLMAYVEMLHRDRSRLSDARKRLNESPLGAAALAGTSFPIDRQMTATALGFDKPMANSMDAVSDRDFALEFLSCLSILTVHLSRLAEEIVIYASAPFKFFELPDQFSTGSSIMPQKRNPDAAELVRAKTGRIIGAMSGLLIMLKGLPLAYSKDMQEDKEPTFMAFDASLLCVAAMTGMVRTLGVNKAAMERAASQGYSTATDLADWLVQNLNVPFRRAHHITGAIVRQAEARNLPLAALPLEDMQAIEPKITSDVFSVLGVKQSTASRKSLGGTAPANVRKAVKAARRKAGR